MRSKSKRKQSVVSLTGAAPALRSLECREGRTGHRLEVDDPIAHRNLLRSFLRQFEEPRTGTHAPGETFSAKARLMMKYRDIEYAVVQGIDIWKWTASVSGVVIMGHAAMKSGAVTAAEKAIDRARAENKLRVVPPRQPN